MKRTRSRSTTTIPAAAASIRACVRALFPYAAKQDVDGGPGECRCAEEDIAGAEAELRDTPADCVGGGRWDQNQCGGVVGEPMPGEQRRDSFGQGVPVAGHVELPKNRSGKSNGDPTHDGLKRFRVERADLDLR